LAGDRFERSALIGGPAAETDRKPQREDPDDQVDRPSGDEAGARQPLEFMAADRSLGLGARKRPRRCMSWRLRADPLSVPVP